MGTNLDDIIKVVVTAQTQITRQQGFTTVLIVGPNPTFSGRIQFYSSSDLTAIAADLTGGTGDIEYKAAAAIAAQNPKVPLIALGREDVGDATMTVTLDAIYAESPDFYGVVTAERDTTKQTAAGAWCLSNEKLYCTADDDPNITDQAFGVDTTSLAYVFQNASNGRVSMFFKGDANVTANKYSDAAYLGQMLAETAGTWTGDAKTLAGESADDLTSTQRKNAHDKFCNTYEQYGAVNIVRQGWTSDGQFTDIVVFLDWLKARIQENVFTLKLNLKKISYDDPGITTVENAVRQILKVAQDNGAITADSFDPVTKARTGGFETSVPLAADVPIADKTNRILKNVKFTCWYTGAVHTIEIDGTVVL